MLLTPFRLFPKDAELLQNTWFLLYRFPRTAPTYCKLHHVWVCSIPGVTHRQFALIWGRESKGARGGGGGSYVGGGIRNYLAPCSSAEVPLARDGA